MRKSQTLCGICRAARKLAMPSSSTSLPAGPSIARFAPRDPSRPPPIHQPSYRRYATAATIQNHYAVLSVDQGATRQQIKAKFYELSKRFHPDAPTGNTEKFHKIGEAYETLSDDAKRREYDMSLAGPSKYTSYQTPSSSYTPYATYSRRPAGPHMAWSSSGRPRPSSNATYSSSSSRPGGNGRNSSDPFASPSPEPGESGGPLFGSGYQPFGRHDGRYATSGDYGDPLNAGLGESASKRNKKKRSSQEEEDPLAPAAFRDPWNLKHREVNDSIFAQAKTGRFVPHSDTAGGLTTGTLVVLTLAGVIWIGSAVVSADDGVECPAGRRTRHRRQAQSQSA